MIEGKRLQLLERLNEVPGVNIPPDSIAEWLSIRLDVLARPEAVERFLSAFGLGA
jgi:hypothetical protein